MAQSLNVDVAEDLDPKSEPTHLGYRLGRTYLIDLLDFLRRCRVHHAAFVLKFGRRAVADVLDELVREVVALFPVHAASTADNTGKL